jgi:hypothetical protein
MRDGVRAVMRRAADDERPPMRPNRATRRQIRDSSMERHPRADGRARAVVVRRARDLEHRPDPRRRR